MKHFFRVISFIVIICLFCPLLAGCSASGSRASGSGSADGMPGSSASADIPQEAPSDSLLSGSSSVSTGTAQESSGSAAGQSEALADASASEPELISLDDLSVPASAPSDGLPDIVSEDFVGQTIGGSADSFSSETSGSADSTALKQSSGSASDSLSGSDLELLAEIPASFDLIHPERPEIFTKLPDGSAPYESKWLTTKEYYSDYNTPEYLLKDFRYDSYGRLLRETVYHPDGTIRQITEYGPDGKETYCYINEDCRRLLSETFKDEAGVKRTYFSYRSDGRPDTEVTNIFYCDYDLFGNPVSGKRFDAYGRLLSHYTYEYDYDASGAKTKCVLYSDNLIESEQRFDALGNLIQEIKYIDGIPYSSEESEYKEELLITRTIHYFTGNAPDYRCEYLYDANGLCLSEEITEGSLNICEWHHITYEYDSMGRMTKATYYYPDGNFEVSESKYTKDGFCYYSSWTENNSYTIYEFDRYGNISSCRYGDAADGYGVTCYYYDGQKRLIREEAYRTGLSDDELCTNDYYVYEYEYDAFSNRIKSTEHHVYQGEVFDTVSRFEYARIPVLTAPDTP